MPYSHTILARLRSTHSALEIEAHASASPTCSTLCSRDRSVDLDQSHRLLVQMAAPNTSKHTSLQLLSVLGESADLIPSDSPDGELLGRQGQEG